MVNRMNELHQLVAKLESAYRDRLVSVLLYGSGVDHRDRLSDINVLYVLKAVTPRELAEGEPILHWWRDLGYPPPVLMSEEETQRSADCFPIEFRDMQDRRKVLYGIDVIADVHVSMKNHRTQVEQELRAKLLRLRQEGAQVLSDPAALLKLCVDSVGTFCTLGRHALLVAGVEALHNRREVVHRLKETLGLPGSPFDILLDFREGKPEAAANPGELFAQYLEFIRRMIEYVDRLPAGTEAEEKS